MRRLYRLRHFFSIFGLTALCLGQSGPDISAYFRLNPTQAPLYRWLHMPPGSITVDPNGDPRFALPPQPPQPDNLTVDPPLVKSLDINGNPHLAILSNAVPPPMPGLGIIIEPLQSTTGGQYRVSVDRTVIPAITPGRGLMSATSAGSMELSIDTALVPYRVPMPASAGPCTDVITGLPLGSTAYAADATGRADCVANPAGDGFVWMKTPGSTTF